MPPSALSFQLPDEFSVLLLVGLSDSDLSAGRELLLAAAAAAGWEAAVFSPDSGRFSADAVRAVVTLSSLSSPSGRLIVIEDAHLLSSANQVTLLKSLEEPSSDTRFALLALGDTAFSPAFRARADAAVALPQLSREQLEGELVAAGVGEDQVAALLEAVAPRYRLGLVLPDLASAPLHGRWPENSKEALALADSVSVLTSDSALRREVVRLMLDRLVARELADISRRSRARCAAAATAAEMLALYVPVVSCLQALVVPPARSR